MISMDDTKEYIFTSEIDPTVTKKITLTNIVDGADQIFYRFAHDAEPLSKESFLCNVDDNLNKEKSNKIPDFNRLLMNNKHENATYKDGDYAISFFMSKNGSVSELLQLQKYMNGAFGNKIIVKGRLDINLGYLNISNTSYDSARKPSMNYPNTYHTNCWRKEGITSKDFLEHFKKISTSTS